MEVSMSSQHSNNDEESFIILGNSSPQTSLDAALMESKIMESSKSSKANSTDSGDNKGSSGSDFYKSISMINGQDSDSHANKHNNEESCLGNITAMSVISPGISFMDNIENKVSDLLKENMILKQTLAKNNVQMKDQFKTIAKWQDDMMKTHQLHKIKFGETKVFIEKLRIEKAELKKKLEDECELNNEYRKQIDQMAGKLENAEKEIVNIKHDNEKIISERDSMSKEIKDINRVLLIKIAKLEEVVKENEKIKEDLEILKMANAAAENKQFEVINEFPKEPAVSSLSDNFVITESRNVQLEDTIDKMSLQLEMVEKQRRQVILENDKMCSEKETLEEHIKKLTQENSDLKLVIRGIEEKVKKEETEQMKCMEEKVTSLRDDLKIAKGNLLEVENVKLEYINKSVESENKIKLLSENVNTLKERLRETLAITFHPVRYSLSLESQDGSSEFSNFLENIRLYDKTLKELAINLNKHSKTYGELFDKVNTWLMDVQLNKENMKPEEFVCKQEQEVKGISHTINEYILVASDLNHQIKSSLSFFEKIFLDYQQVLKVNKDFEDKHVGVKEKLLAYDHLVAKVMQMEIDLSKESKEKLMLVAIVKTLQKESEERDLLREQLNVYKADFEAERDSRAHLASEKEELLSNLQEIQKHNQTLVSEVDKLRDSQPSTSRASPLRPMSLGTAFVDSDFKEEYSPSKKHICPLCNMSLISMKMLQEHVETCLDALKED